MSGPHYTQGDRYYLLRLPGEKKATRRTRATTFIDAIDDKEGLISWSADRHVRGLFADEALRKEAAHLYEDGGDPWYASLESKDEAKETLSKLFRAGGGHARSDIGTAIHAVLASAVSGRIALDEFEGEWREQVVAVLQTLTEHKYAPDPEMCERSVWNERYGAVGTFDLSLWAPNRSLPIIGDLKTGGDELWTWHEKRSRWIDTHALSDAKEARQLALYASANAIIEWPEDPEDECILHEMPSFDQSVGVIAHIPAKQLRCNLRVLDLEVGRQGLEACAAVRTARKGKALVSLTVEAPTLPPINGSLIDMRMAIEARIADLREWGRLDMLKRAWPSHLPTLKQSTNHSRSDLLAIGAVVSHLWESNVPLESPFGDRAPQPPPHPVDGAPQPGRFEPMIATLKALGPHATSRARQWTQEAKAAGVAFNFSNPHERNMEILEAVLVLAERDDGLIDAALAGVGQVEGTVGARLGRLTIEQAKAVRELALLFEGDASAEVLPNTEKEGTQS